MNDEAAAQVAPAPAKAKPAKKPVKKAAAKPEAKKTALPFNRPQGRILKALAKSKTGLMSVDQIAEKAEVAKSWVVGYTFKACAANKGPSLAELKLVKEVEVDVDGKKERLAQLTAPGTKAAAKVE